MSNQARQLVENISDQYVLLAADPAQAFAAAAQKKKKNRAKIFAIAAAAAAMYIIITVSLIIGALTPPDDPVAPPDDGPGAQDQPEQPGGPDDPSQHEPEIHLPDAEFFEQHLSGFWEISDILTSPWPDTGIPDSVIVLNFQSDGRAYVFEEIDGKSTLGKYSVADDHIQIYTLDSEQQWMLYGKMKISTQSDQTHLYAGGLIFDRIEDTNVANLSIRGTLEAAETEVDIKDFYIGSIRFDSRAFDFGHIAPVYLEHTSMKFDRAPSFFVGQADTVNYKVYDKHMELLEEGSQKIDIEGSFYLGALEENGLYYVELSCMYTSRSAIREIELCYFLTIQIGEEKTDDPVTPPTYPEPEINLPEPLMFVQHLQSYWTSDWAIGWGNINYIFNFQLDGRVHIIDLDNKTSEVGRYSIADDTIELWTLTEGVGWEKSDITLQLQLGDHPSYTTMLVSVGGKTETYIRMTSQDEHLELWNYDIKPSEGKAVYSYFIEQATLLDWPSLTFELPSIEYFKQLEVFQFTSFPKSFQFSSIPYSQYRIYNEDLELIFEGECATMRSSEQLEFEVPDEDGLYYLDVIANPAYRTSFHSSIFEELAVHYYAAIQVGEEDDDPDTYTPPKSTTDSILIENCDTQPSGAFTLDTTNPVEGEGCWSITTPAAGALAFHAWENGIDASGRDVIEFDLYISDLAALEAMKKNCALELSSSETCDYQEIAFSGEQIVEFGRYGQEWQVGWNHVVLRIADATATNGPGTGSGKEGASFDISNVNFVRFYLLTATTSHTIKIDNICLSVEQK
ncbi:MAG: hypothetical protein IJW09_03745 [Clostridia bacterium]|nr:hypothetical protein [Clostridia bacterium]